MLSPSDNILPDREEKLFVLKASTRPQISMARWSLPQILYVSRPVPSSENKPIAQQQVTCFRRAWDVLRQRRLKTTFCAGWRHLRDLRYPWQGGACHRFCMSHVLSILNGLIQGNHMTEPYKARFLRVQADPKP